MIDKSPVLEISNLSKNFGMVKANKDINMSLYRGEILSILGENGSGKSTLINMMAGIYMPDSGHIFIDGHEADIRTPRDASGYGIGVVHQHFKLVDSMSALDNVLICLEDNHIRKKDVKSRMLEISKQYGFKLSPDKKICDMSVSEKQTVEIIKVLIKGAQILILDEPTAVLTPAETEGLFKILRLLRSDNKAIIIITHKLQEVLNISDRVYLMRKGSHVGTVKTQDATVEGLTAMMVGRSVELSIECPKVLKHEKYLEVRGVDYSDADGKHLLDDISFDLYSGEILGVAGIAGSGQNELSEILAGVRKTKNGEIMYLADGISDISRMNVAQRERAGIRIGFVPEDRLGMGLISDGDIVENLMLRDNTEKRNLFVDRRSADEKAHSLIEKLEIATPGTKTPVRMLSGGNIQKVLLGREILRSPRILIVAYPVRGLDINSSYMVYQMLNNEKKKGAAILFIAEDLDVIMEISDRVMVLSDGVISGIVDPKTTSRETIGTLMTKSRGEV